LERTNFERIWQIKEEQEKHGMKSREQLEIAMPGSSSWMPYASQRVKGFDDDDEVEETRSWS
jgi:hypothetical protein